MANYLPDEVIADIRALRSGGKSIRAISRQLGISKNTVSRYVNFNDGAQCDCGKPAGHKGWCQPMYAKSTARQAFHASRRGVRITVPPQPRRSRVTEARAEKMRWLGLAEQNCTTLLPRSVWDEIFHEIADRTRRVDFQIREDVRHEMFLACIQGRLPRTDIKRAVTTFITFVMRGNCYHDTDTVSATDLFQRNGHGRLS